MTGGGDDTGWQGPRSSGPSEREGPVKLAAGLAVGAAAVSLVAGLGA